MENPEASQLGALLAAAHSARQRPINLRGRLITWRHQGHIDRGFDRWSNARQAASGRLGGAGSSAGHVVRSSVQASFRIRAGARGPQRPEESTSSLQVVARWPDRWRLEGGWVQGGPTLTVIDGATWMSWSAQAGASSNFGAVNHGHGNPAAEMLDPTPLLGSDIEGLTAGEMTGRATWRLRAAPRDRAFVRPSARWAWEHCIDDYELDVDRETGLVICLIGRVDGEHALRYRFEDLEFGIELADDAFSLLPPDGRTPKDARRQHEPPG